VPQNPALLAFGCYKAIRSGRELLPFVLSVGLFMLAYTGLAISKFPYLVPPVEGAEGLTVWQTAAALESQIFVLIGVLILLQIILTYTVLSYWSFRSKVRLGAGYH
jgi:cytochrome d ubiquinol oxidase subunit II